LEDIMNDINQQGGTEADRYDELSQQARAIGRDVKNKASDLTDAVTRTAKDQLAEVGAAAKDLASQTRGKVETTINEQKSAGADYIGLLASAAQRAAGEFEGDVPQAARLIRQAAVQIGSVAVAVRDRDVRELVGEVEQFARRQPTLFFGGALFLGFAAVRFLKSSSAHPGAPDSTSLASVKSPSVSPGGSY
jgi:ElaB/YqjD/DUF883 family membrane-anchored ribosome-binding protein